MERILKRIRQQDGVTGVIVVNHENIAIRSTLDQSQTQTYIKASSDMLQMSYKVVREADPTNDLRFVRIRTKKNELLIAPENDYRVIVIQEDPETWSG